MKKEMESERGSYSDRMKWKKRDQVRKQFLFGQVKKEKARWSLKAGLIRTGPEGKSEMESESRPYSDRSRRKKRDGVEGV